MIWIAACFALWALGTNLAYEVRSKEIRCNEGEPELHMIAIVFWPVVALVKLLKAVLYLIGMVIFNG